MQGRKDAAGVHCQKDSPEFCIFRKFQQKLMYFSSLSLSHKTSSFNDSVLFFQYSQAHRSSSFQNISFLQYLTKQHITCMLKETSSLLVSISTHCTVYRAYTVKKVSECRGEKVLQHGIVRAISDFLTEPRTIPSYSW